MRIHIYSNKTNRLVNVVENVAEVIEKSTFYLVHIRGEKWFDQVLVDKNEYTVFIEQ